LGDGGIVGDGVADDADDDGGGLAGGADEDGGFAEGDGGDEAGFGDGGDLAVVGDVEGLGGDVLATAVGHNGDDEEAVLLVLFEGEDFGVDLEGGDAAGVVFRRAEGGALTDPVGDGLILRGIDGETLAATVGHGSGGLAEKEAFGGVLEVDARGARRLRFGGENLIFAALDDPFVVVLREERGGGELQAASAFDAAVAGGRVAAALRQNGADGGAEAEFRGAGGDIDAAGGRGAELAVGGGDL
jgi:hypothetical protein